MGASSGYTLGYAPNIWPGKFQIVLHTSVLMGFSPEGETPSG